MASQAWTRCSSECVLLERSTATPAARVASADPSVAKRVFVGNASTSQAPLSPLPGEGSFLAHDHNRTVSVAGDGVRDAAYQCSPNYFEASATHHQQVGADLLGQDDNFLVRSPRHEVRLHHALPGFPQPLYLRLEQLFLASLSRSSWEP